MEASAAARVSATTKALIAAAALLSILITSGEAGNHAVVRIRSKLDQSYSMGVDFGRVVMVPRNDSDPRQRWIKELVFRSDEEGHGIFALVNEATKKPLFNAGRHLRVRLADDSFKGTVYDSIAWSRSALMVDTFTTIRSGVDISSNLAISDSDIYIGASLLMWDWVKTQNQLWLMEILAQFPPTSVKT